MKRNHRALLDQVKKSKKPNQLYQTMRHRAVILKVVKHMSQAVEEAHKMVSKFLEEKTLRCPTCQTLMDADYAYCCRECYKKANSGVAVS